MIQFLAGLGRLRPIMRNWLPVRSLLPLALGTVLWMSSGLFLPIAANQPLRPDPTSFRVRDAQSPDTAESQNPIQGVIDNVREKLNLDEPLYPPTKELLDSAQDPAQDTQDTAQQAVRSTRETLKDVAQPVKGNRSH